MTKVAFIGLGAMGEPMAANLIKKGLSVTVVPNRRREPAERLQALGAKIAQSAESAAKDADIVILMLPSSKEVESTLTGPGKVLDAMPAGSVVLDCSTSDPKSTRSLQEALAAKGVSIVDAPVTRGAAGAKGGTLAFFVGGSDADFERVKPALSAMGDTFHRMGVVGNGHATKLLTNALSYGTVALVNEMLLLGKAFGLDLAELQPALISGAGSKALEAFGPRIIAREYTPARVSVGNVRAHLQTALTLAPSDKAPLKVLGAAKDLYEQAGALGQDSSDMSALAELWPR